MAIRTINQLIDGAGVFPLFKKAGDEVRFYQFSMGQDITGWTIDASCDYQSLVFDSLQYNVKTGEYNWQASKQIGYFPSVTLIGGDLPTITNASTGAIKMVLPANMYSGPILADQSLRPVVTFVSVKLNTDAGEKIILRLPVLEVFEAGASQGDPVTGVGYQTVPTA